MFLRNIVLCLFLRYVNSRVTLGGNGYEDILVEFPISVESHRRISLLENLQNLLSDASSLLYEATNKGVFFQRITILLPRDWDDPSHPVATSEHFRSPDIILTEGGDQFWAQTQQSGPCGQLGDVIRLPVRLILDGYNKTSVQNLVSQWARYRYGVFPEVPLDDDKLCYFDANGEWKVAGCLDSKPQLTDIDCSKLDFRPSFHDLKVSSSLMSILVDPKMSRFCEKTGSAFGHDDGAPTRHNEFCDGRSVTEVILDSKDFKGTPLDGALKTTEFNLVVNSDIERYVFVILKSTKNQASHRFKDLYLTISRVLTSLVKYVLPERTEVSFVIVSDTVRASHESMETLTEDNRRRLINFLNVKSPEHAEFLLFRGGLKKANQLLGNDSGSIIVIGVDENVQAFQIEEEFPARGFHHKVSALSLVPTSSQWQNFQTLKTVLAERSGVAAHVIYDDSKDLGLLWKMTLTLTTLLSTPWSNQPRLSVIHRSNFSSVSAFAENIIIPSYSSGRFVTMVHCGGKASVTSESVRPDQDQNFHYFSSTFNQISKGELKLRMKSSGKISCIVVTVVREMFPLGLQSHAWMRQNNVTKWDPTVTALYGSLKESGWRTPPGTSMRVIVDQQGTADSSTAFIIQLFDSGAEPDVESSDGVFSAFWIPKVTPGGVSFYLNVSWPSGSRGYSHRYLYLDALPLRRGRPNPAMETFSPSKIRNLRSISITDSTKGTVRFSWTAPGAHLDKGEVKEYEVRYAFQQSDLDDNRFPLSSRLIPISREKPRTSGDREDRSYSMPSIVYGESDLQVVFFAVRSINLFNNTSLASNKVLLTIRRPAEVDPTLEEVTTVLSTAHVNYFTKKEVITIISSTSASLVLITIIIALLCLCCYTKCKKRRILKSSGSFVPRELVQADSDAEVRNHLPPRTIYQPTRHSGLQIQRGNGSVYNSDYESSEQGYNIYDEVADIENPQLTPITRVKHVQGVDINRNSFEYPNLGQNNYGNLILSPETDTPLGIYETTSQLSTMENISSYDNIYEEPDSVHAAEEFRRKDQVLPEIPIKTSYV